MKFELKKIIFEGFSFETEKERSYKRSYKGLILAIGITFILAVSVGIFVAVRVNVDYSYTNKPQLEQKTPVSNK
jgi:hypothetical protein